MEIIKDGQIVANDWRHLSDDEAVPEQAVTVSLSRWRNEKDRQTTFGIPLGLRLNSDDPLEEIVDDLKHFSIVVLEFRQFTDGRSFSLARLLRERYGFDGEIRARGDFIRDQMFFLTRVGVNAFEPKDAQNLQDMLPALKEFTVKYQAAVDVKVPLRRRPT
ncbi:DUF934 domain-containing protein [Methylocaldum szegediense]|uniref:Oxidoreductase probably involved in sulfite reduction n=1 Tax=Methylocaldum szegediense TaxID=73780 RepID=A0ABN8X8G2_9GAMM|nr:DUF934 domain-containing protein [Methylocaldum szegediense]CAI8942214.1 conserved protein of unknown function [Methylocaldum szegediense]